MFRILFFYFLTLPCLVGSLDVHITSCVIEVSIKKCKIVSSVTYQRHSSLSGGRHVGGPALGHSRVLQAQPFIDSFCCCWISPHHVLRDPPEKPSRSSRSLCLSCYTWAGACLSVHPEEKCGLTGGASTQQHQAVFAGLGPFPLWAQPGRNHPSPSLSAGEEDVKLDFTAVLLCIPFHFSVTDTFLGIFPWFKISKKIKNVWNFVLWKECKIGKERQNAIKSLTILRIEQEMELELQQR